MAVDACDLALMSFVEQPGGTDAKRRAVPELVIASIPDRVVKLTAPWHSRKAVAAPEQW
jgi:hypothetical protein